MDKLLVPVDFVIMRTDNAEGKDRKKHVILLGRLFLATANAFVRIAKGIAHMEVLGEKVTISSKTNTWDLDTDECNCITV